MTIDPTSETLMSLVDAARSLPARRGGKRPHTSCVYRWTTTGCRGVILESIQVGGTRCTSREALARFFARLTHANSPKPQRPPTRRQRADEATEKELDRAGI
jgi:hypothetical protein